MPSPLVQTGGSTAPAMPSPLDSLLAAQEMDESRENEALNQAEARARARSSAAEVATTAAIVAAAEAAAARAAAAAVDGVAYRWCCPLAPSPHVYWAPKLALGEVKRSRGAGRVEEAR